VGSCPSDLPGLGSDADHRSKKALHTLVTVEHNGGMKQASDSSPGLWRGLIDDPKHGPLPALLMVMTATTGIVDAVSILSLGRVFVANMTGNVVFVGFALAGAKGFSLAASLFALAGFLFGALGGGWTLRRLRLNRALLLRNTVSVEFVLLVVALIVAIVAGSPIPAAEADVIAACLAIALGLQNSVVRRLAIPDLTTTVLTMTLTGIAADVPKGNRSVVGRRILAVVTMLAGAVGGALLVLRVNPPAALGLAAGLLAVVLVAITVAALPAAGWQT
jgi:uncharacterized membrane protein YoaK (UPF0700 family)